MESENDNQDVLFLSIIHSNMNEFKRIVKDHPELINEKRTVETRWEVSTPLIEACKRGL